MQRSLSGGGRSASISADVFYSVFCAKKFIKKRTDVRPGSHIGVLFLYPTDFRRAVFFNNLFHTSLRKGIKLFYPHKSDVTYFPLFSFLKQLVIDFSAAKEDFSRFLCKGIIDDF